VLNFAMSPPNHGFLSFVSTDVLEASLHRANLIQALRERRTSQRGSSHVTLDIEAHCANNQVKSQASHPLKAEGFNHPRPAPSKDLMA
jgi:hypothetical protein